MDKSAANDTAKTVFKKIGPGLGNLYDRWQDEKEYEDFNDYIKAAKSAVEKQNVTFVKMTKRPFAVTFKIANFTYVVKVSARDVQLNAQA